MSNILLVPVHLDALVLDQDEMVVEATADFSRLPFFTGKRDINPDIANISEEIVAMPFQNRNLRLNKGIHLHWSLPDALTKARPDPNKPDVQDFPRVPNRWLVTRTDRGSSIKKEWLIESDYLYPATEGNVSGRGVTVPYHKAPAQAGRIDKDSAQPFRYMGRVLELPQQGRDQGEYYPKLTAVGYGEPTFAAFYPNCHSVFGFCDEDYSGTTDGRRYYVMGWYSNPDHDVLKTHIMAAVRDGGPDAPTLLEQIFKWKFDLSYRIDLPSRMMCYARIDLLQRKALRQHGRASVAIGNTGTEALSACLAPSLRSNAPKHIVEDQLEALHLAPSLEYRQLDVPAKFVEGRHEKGFTAVPGGTLWTIQIESPVDKPAQADGAPTPTVPPELGRLLNTLNKCQADYDRAWQKIESLRIQLFSDWYKYMLCAYPPEDSRDAYPDIDEVKSYVEYRTALLDKDITDAGEVTLNETGEAVVARLRFGAASSPAGALVEAINKLQTSLQKPFRLKQTSGPRYWRPTEPSVLIDGSIAEPSRRHGQDGLKTGGLVPTDVLTGVDSVDLAETRERERFRQRIDGIGASAKNFGFTTWETQPWNPFLLEWEIEVFPVEYHSNIDPATGRFQEDFITANYQLLENDVDLSLKPGRGAWTLAANNYSGRSILTPHATAQLTLRSEIHIEREVLPLYLEEKKLLMSKRGSDFFATHMKDIQTWYERSATSKQLRAANPADDTTLTAFHAWSATQTPQRLSQSLSGFNEALLMHKQTLQLLVADPLGFSDYQPFAKFVGNTVHRSIYSAPEPLNDFNPIRSGMMKIHRLRLVDTFGQTKDLDVSKIILSESLDDGTPDTLVNLPPRLTQPARVNFRWLSADADQEMNDHPATTPVCGWVLANHLDNSLMIYDSGGKALGSLLKKDEAVVWEPAPGGRPADSIGEANPHLKKVVKTIKDWGPDFLDDFISAIDSAVENIEPENFVHHEDLALLMGRPLALVRALVNLELKGLPASHQGWNEFRQDMERKTRDDNGFTQVKFPIRIGEYRQFNDGTVGYWKEKKDGTYEDNAFFAPQSDANVKFKGDHLKTHKTHPEAMVFHQTVQADPQILTLLIDPRGSVHATSGIVPVKAINIPPHQYAEALQAIELTFLSTPIITDAGKIHLPLPEEAGYQWSWLQDVRGKWSEVSSRGVVRKETFAAEFQSKATGVWNELAEFGWIEIDKDDATRASVTPKDKREVATLNVFKDLTERIEDLLDRAHIGPVNLTAKFTGPQEIREGWLKLSVAQTPGPRLKSGSGNLDRGQYRER
ncbi:MAG TPA: hypothetical protein VN659_01100 [Pyrinomonadaceae bacterium]|nr:hypothetical protein [Pyrinomonadaceae bacterium]